MSDLPRQPIPEPEPEAVDPDEARLADLLDACLRAERATPGASADLVRQAPDALRDDLTNLMTVAHVLDATAWPSPTPEFRARARARFQAAAPESGRLQRIAPRRSVAWLVRLGAAAAVLVVASYTSVLASVSSLPGQPLYSVKRADEAITLGLTRDDLSRAFVLLQQAGARLDEVSRLAGTGQVQPAADLLQQYASTLERATASLSGAPGAEPRRAEFEAGVRQQREQLDSIGREAPPPLRSSIAQAQAVATQELAQAQGISVAGAVAPNPTPDSTPDPTANSANPASTSNPNANANPTTTAAPRPAASPLPAASPSAGAATRPAASPSPESRP